MSTYGAATYGTGTYGALVDVVTPPGSLPSGIDTNLPAPLDQITTGNLLEVLQSRPLPLELQMEVTDGSGTRYGWGANERAGARLQRFSFSTKLGEGFSTGGGSLARNTDRDYPDLDLLNGLVARGADGSVAYEGRIGALPRDLQDTHSIGVNLIGWMAHARDDLMSEIYVDRDISQWTAPTNARRTMLRTANFAPVDATNYPGTDAQGVTTEIGGSWTLVNKPISEAWYYAPSYVPIGHVYYEWVKGAKVDSTDTNWNWDVIISPTADMQGTLTQSGNLRGAGPGSGGLPATIADGGYAVVRAFYNTGPGGEDGGLFNIDWKRLTVYGRHGLTLRPGLPGEPAGFYASDVIRNIARRWCPRLDPSGVMDSSYVVQHLAFREMIHPYDAFLELNKYHLWQLAVWENRVLHFAPFDFTDYDWAIRTDEPGVTWSAQGSSTEDLFNGIIVQYTDLLTGRVEVLRPDIYPELRDLSPTNPYNIHGIMHPDKIELSSPTLRDQAIQIGRAALAETNRPKAPGTITVSSYIRDRAGHLQPAWRVRAGDTISITSHPNDGPRLVTETSWDDDSKTLTIAVDLPMRSLDAVLDRLAAGRALI